MINSHTLHTLTHINNSVRVPSLLFSSHFFSCMRFSVAYGYNATGWWKPTQFHLQTQRKSQIIRIRFLPFLSLPVFLTHILLELRKEKHSTVGQTSVYKQNVQKARVGRQRRRWGEEMEESVACSRGDPFTVSDATVQTSAARRGDPAYSPPLSAGARADPWTPATRPCASCAGRASISALMRLLCWSLVPCRLL